MFYKKGVDISSNKSMFDFLNNHFMYDTMNSWNGLRSIANNVKVYNLQLDGDAYTALAFLEDDEYSTINDLIRDWETEHPGYSVGFNGRSGGYLVLYNDDNYKNILPDYLCGFDSYEDFKENYKDYYGSMEDAKYELREYTKLVQDFDKLCDALRDHTNTLSKLNFALTKVHDCLDNFNFDYKSDLEELNITEPRLKETDGKNFSIKIDSSMRKYRSLMECFIKEITNNIWKIKDNELDTIQLETF